MPNREHRPVWRWKSTPIPLAMVVVVLVCGLIFGCRELTTSSQFSVQQEAGVLWLTRPDGQRFFSFGVNCANRGETNAPDGTLAYHAEAIYPSDAAWASSIADRLTDWGFTTIGGWSDWELLGRLPDTRFIHTPVLHVGSAAGAPWRDLWNPQWTAVMEEQARAHIKTSDARVMGRYSDNELGWWNGALFRETLDHLSTSGQRQRLVALLREMYENDWSRLLGDFEPVKINSFEDLEQAGQVYLRPGGRGIDAYRRFLAIIAARFYQLTSHVVRGQTPHGLLLGDRYAASYYPELIHAAAQNLDVISTNLKASWNDGTFARFYLDTIHSLSGKPVMISEIYLAAMENTTGNRNRYGGFPTVATQAERASAVRQSLIELTRLPYVVGVDWFQYYDESSAGRYDGEDFNMGLVDIHDRPYTNLVASLAGMDLSQLHGFHHPPRSDATHGVPPAPNNPIGNWKPREALREWDRERGFVPTSSSGPFADLYLSWNQNELWLGVYAMDTTEREYYQNRKVPEADRMHWRVTLNGAKTEFTIRLGAGGHDVRIEKRSLDGAEYRTLAYDTRAVAVLRVSASELGNEFFKPGDVIELDSILESHARAERTDWNGSFTLD